MTQPVEATCPWPDDEIMARYGLCLLTPEEQQACPVQGRRVFPDLRLALEEDDQAAGGRAPRAGRVGVRRAQPSRGLDCRDLP